MNDLQRLAQAIGEARGDIGLTRVSGTVTSIAAGHLTVSGLSRFVSIGDRIVLGELRGAESVSFLRAINTGHPGSFSTIHANSLTGALEQLALMVMQTGIGLSRSDTIAYATNVIDVLVQLGRDETGKRGITQIAESRDLVPTA